MNTKEARLSHERLMYLLDYDTSTGVFTRKTRTCNRVKAGSRADVSDGCGYLRVRVDNIVYRAHRLAWFYVTGRWPTYIDHINRDKEDNRFSNLRECTLSENCVNKDLKKTNKSGVKGVCWHKSTKKWICQIQVNKKNTYLGVYDTLDEAKKVIAEARIKYYGDFANEN